MPDRNNIPDLDHTDAEELMTFWNKHQNGRKAKDLFPEMGVGSRKATAALANYAIMKAAAVGCRLRGDIDTAFYYERICENIYDDLPRFARF